MREIKVKIYTFEELSSDVQKAVLDKYRFCPIENWDWWQYVYADFIDDVKEKYGVTLDSDNISFDGFYCQGDGASFTHDFTENEVKSLFKSLNIKFRKGLKHIFYEYVLDWIKIERFDFRDYHENSVIVTYSFNYIDDNYGITKSYPLIDEYFYKKATQIEYVIEKWKNELCQDLYSRLQKEYEYLTSDDIVKESIIDAGLEFYKDGELV